MYGMQPCHEGTSARRANWVDVVVVENHPAVGQRVDVGGRNLVRTVEPDVVPSLPSIFEIA